MRLFFSVDRPKGRYFGAKMSLTPLSFQLDALMAAIYPVDNH